MALIDSAAMAASSRLTSASGEGSLSNTIRRKASSFEEHSLTSKAWERRGLSLRAADALVDNGILTLDDLHRAHELKLATIPGIGRKSLALLCELMGQELPGPKPLGRPKNTNQIHSDDIQQFAVWRIVS
jgi:DNA-directed RNA polymerase alpha subunit